MPKLLIPKPRQNYLSKITSPIKQSPIKTPSITSGDGENLSDADKILFEDFGSLYREECEEGSSLPQESPRPPDDLRGSGRFSVESPADKSEEQAGGDLAPEDFVMLQIDSPDPYDALRESILEMVELRIDHDRSVDWKFLEELLFCYLDMNDKESHRHILQAFVDVIVFLRQNSASLL
ncbi:transcription repressor OFP14-like [Salvia divinorum]|uniref:Transcription repressor n=1 Tax=Salvia divinorum TaxID=28513 RepID=A0ABD1I9S5_SALDI